MGTERIDFVSSPKTLLSLNTSNLGSSSLFEMIIGLPFCITQLAIPQPSCTWLFLRERFFLNQSRYK